MFVYYTNLFIVVFLIITMFVSLYVDSIVFILVFYFVKCNVSVRALSYNILYLLTNLYTTGNPRNRLSKLTHLHNELTCTRRFVTRENLASAML